MASPPVPCGCLSVLFLNFIVHGFSDVVITKDTPELVDFDFFIREDWGALPFENKRPLNLPVPYVIIHHTPKTSACYFLRECGEAVRAIEKQHVQLNLGNIGYNFCIGSEGGVFEGRGWTYKGSHSGPANKESIGICMIGNWTTEVPPQIQLDTLKSVLRTGVLLGHIRKDYKLIGHTEIRNTLCPGSALMKEISTWDHFVPFPPRLDAEQPLQFSTYPYQNSIGLYNTYPSNVYSPYEPWHPSYY